MSTSKAFWFKQLKTLTDRRRALFERHEQLLPWSPWTKVSFGRQLTRLNDEEAALLRMGDDLEVLVRRGVGAPESVYHRADWPCPAAMLSSATSSTFWKVRPVPGTSRAASTAADPPPRTFQ